MKKVTSIVLTLLLLLSSFGVSYAEHYCGSFRIASEVTLGQKFLSCGMVMEEAACEDTNKEEDGCCDNHYVQVDTDDSFNKTSYNYTFTVNFVTSFVHTFLLQQVELPSKAKECYKDYSPPPLIRDVQILYETFLI